MNAAIIMLLGNAEDLAPIHDWPPAGALVEEVLEIARGSGGGLSERDATRLRVWARRYQQLIPQVRDWYARHAGDGAVGAALWCVLDGRPSPSYAAYGQLVKLWEEDHGDRPAFDLCPRID